jgi:hypothetical protein
LEGSDGLFDDDEDEGQQQELPEYESDSESDDGSEKGGDSQDELRNGGLPKAKKFY